MKNKKEAIAVLKMHGYTLDGMGRLVPPATWITITRALKDVSPPAPDRATIKRNAQSGEIKSVKENRVWKLFKPSFDEWLSKWQRREIQRQEEDDDFAISSLGFSYDPAAQIFPDPRQVDLILLDQAYERNEFVIAFTRYHQKLPVLKVFSEVDKKIRQAIGRARKILWISDKEIPMTMDRIKFIVWIPESDDLT